MTFSQLQIWIMACRPKTLPAAIAPVMIATAMAVADGGYHIHTAILTLMGAVFIQIGTNLANDYFDFQNGADTHDRVGPTRVTQSGLLRPRAVRVGFIICFGIAAVIAELLFLRAGWPIAVIALAAITSGILYTAGPRPLGYIGLGEIFVFIFFGPVAVAGTYYVQTLELNPAIVLAGFAPGFISAAVLAVNNLRDIETDRRSKKNTLAVRFGPAFARIEYYLLIVAASLMPLIIYKITADHYEIIICSLTAIIAAPVIHTVMTKSDGPSLNRALAQTGGLLILYSILFSIGWIYADIRF